VTNYILLCSKNELTKSRNLEIIILINDTKLWLNTVKLYGTLCALCIKNEFKIVSKPFILLSPLLNTKAKLRYLTKFVKLNVKTCK